MKISEMKRFINLNCSFIERSEVARIILSMYIGYTDNYSIIRLSPYGIDMLEGVYKVSQDEKFKIYMGNDKYVFCAFDTFNLMLEADPSMCNKTYFNIHTERLKKVFNRFESIENARLG